MVQDKSVDFQDTWSFLQRRIDDTKTITNARQQLDGLVGGALKFGTAAFTTVSWSGCGLCEDLFLYKIDSKHDWFEHSISLKMTKLF